MYEKISIKTTSGLGVESVIAVLVSNGITGMEIIDSKERVSDLKSLAGTWDYADESLLECSEEASVVFYIEKADDRKKMLGKIESELKQLNGIKIERELEDADKWQNEWKKHFKQTKIGKIVIVPEWTEYIAERGETVFRIDPGAAFGTGQHESTKLCIYALQEYVKREDLVLDIGCGSGILSCICSLIGAKKVVACDIDPIGAINATKRNARLNGISNIEVLAGEATSELPQKLSKEKYDVIIANIVADVIIELVPFVKEYLKQSGKFISSGIIGERAAEVRAKFFHEGLNIIWEKELNDWHAFVVSKYA